MSGETDEQMEVQTADKTASEENLAEVTAPLNVESADATTPTDNYVESDVFSWANNLVQYKDELNIQLFFFNKNYVMYKTSRSPDLDKQLEPIFIDGLLEFVLQGADEGLIVRGFEEAEAEDKVLQRTRTDKVDKLKEVLGWLNTQEHEIETFKEEEHDIKRIKGVIARCSHPEMSDTFYVVKMLPQAQVMKGKTGWMLRGDKFVPFDAEAAIHIPTDNQLLVLNQDLYVFNQSKLKSLFGYDAKEASIAEARVREIEDAFNLSFADGATMQDLLKGKRGTVKKLQKLEVGKVSQEDVMNVSEELNIGLMEDDAGAIIIMDDKDLAKFVNILNEDYFESPTTGERFEIISKKPLKIKQDDDENLAAIPAEAFKPSTDSK